MCVRKRFTSGLAFILLLSLGYHSLRGTYDDRTFVWGFQKGGKERTRPGLDDESPVLLLGLVVGWTERRGDAQSRDNGVPSSLKA